MTSSRATWLVLRAAALAALTALALAIVLLASSTRAQAHVCGTVGDVVTACGTCASGTHTHSGPDGIWCQSREGAAWQEQYLEMSWYEY